MVLFLGLLFYLVVLSHTTRPLKDYEDTVLEPEENKALSDSLNDLSDWSGLQSGEDGSSKKGVLIFADAGSSGTTIMATDTSTSSVLSKIKVLAKCTDNTDSMSLTGLAVLAYEFADCKPTISFDCGNDSGCSKALEKLKKTDASNTLPEVGGVSCLPPYYPSKTFDRNEEKPFVKMLMLLATKYLLQDTYLLDSNNVPITSSDGQPTQAKPANAANIPIIATAGMRMQSKEDNENVWRFICKCPGLDGESKQKVPELLGDFDFAEGGLRCGTAAGTQEAYYEFLANVMSGDSSIRTGTFTIGGQSAQIAIPFTDSPSDTKAKDNFIKLQRELQESMFKKCGNVRMPGKRGKTDWRGFSVPNDSWLDPEKGGNANAGWHRWQFVMAKDKTYADNAVMAQILGTAPIPFFLSNESTNECYKDFIDYIDVKEMPATLVAKGLQGVQGVGVISFLGGLTYKVHSRNTRGPTESIAGESIAGGANAISHWATQENNRWDKDGTCDHTRETFNMLECYARLKDALKFDFMYQAVRSYFTNNTFDTKTFSYNTPAAMPSKAVGWDDLQKMGNSGQQKVADVAHILESHVLELQATHDTEVGMTLLEEIFAICNGRAKMRSFGFRNQNTCVKAAWTAMYINEFFGNKQHQEDHLYYKALEWPVGAIAALTPSVVRQAAHMMVRALWSSA